MTGTLQAAALPPVETRQLPAAMTLAAVDRLVHHSTIFEMNVESYRRRVAAARTPRKPRGASDSKNDSETG